MERPATSALKNYLYGFQENATTSMRYLLSILVMLFLFACDDSTTVNQGEEQESGLPLKDGKWLMSMDLGGHILPFNFELTEHNGDYNLYVINHSEKIEVEDVIIKGDSIIIDMPVFNSEFIGKISSSSAFEGRWYNYAKSPDYFIPFTAEYGVENRFAFSDVDEATPTQGKWEVTFSPDAEDNYKAIGDFKQYGVHLTGTFITETGDYRYLDGIAMNDSLYLSCFDGSHAFLFKAAQNESGELNGQFWSGSHWNEPWVAQRNDEFKLRDPDSLTYLKSGYDKFEFSFPDLDSNMVSLDDPKYHDKVVIIQIMGSWCPNCLDETRLYVDLYNQYNTQGLEIISLAYEREENFKDASLSVRGLKSHLHANYDFLVAGVSNKKRAAETLPMLNHVMSYPTSIFIDRNGNIRKIHTGFYGPGTGEYYTEYVAELNTFLEGLLAEEL